jgi:branched-chain amino acid transport system permease protein
MILSFTQFFVDDAGVGQILFFVIVALFFYFRPGGIFGGPMEEPPGEVASLLRGRPRITGWTRTTAMVVAGLLIIALPYIVRSSYWQTVLIMMIIYAVIAMTFNVGMRAGMINVCSAAFWGIGAYSTGMLMTKLHLGFWEALPITLVICFIVALGIGVVISRFAAMLGMMLTIVFASIVPLIFSSFKWFGRNSGISGINTPGKLGPIEISSVTSYYYLVLVFAVVCVIIMLAFNKAWTGRTWLSLASSPRLSQAIGVSPARYRLISFVIMSIIPGLMGTVYASFLGAINPGSFGAMSGINFIMAAFIGGLSYFVLGSIVGSAIIVLLPEVLRFTGNWELIIVAVIVILIVMLMPRGILGGLDRLVWRNKPAAVTEGEAFDRGGSDLMALKHLVAPSRVPAQIAAPDMDEPAAKGTDE